MQPLSLTGQLSFIDGKKLVFEFLDNYDEDGIDDAGNKSTSRDKLTRAFRDEYYKPYDVTTFRVFSRDVTPDIVNMTGRQVKVRVVPQKYSFVSQAKHNKGERVTGYKLALDAIDVIKHV